MKCPSNEHYLANRTNRNPTEHTNPGIHTSEKERTTQHVHSHWYSGRVTRIAHLGISGRSLTRVLKPCFIPDQSWVLQHGDPALNLCHHSVD